MAEQKVVEVRFDVTLHDLSEEQVFGLLSAFDGDRNISVGLGYGGCAAVVLLDVPAMSAAAWGHEVKAEAEHLGLTVDLVEVLDVDEYEARALAEDVG